ncbi:MAG TPA: hypothetical protein VFU35_13985 [Jatrophihabitans sp.]|nr:hypothetical protein [Jatrophihabitans sp.]
MTPTGFEVTIGAQTDRFPHLEEALVVAHQWLTRAEQLRELSARIE